MENKNEANEMQNETHTHVSHVARDQNAQNKSCSVVTDKTTNTRQFGVAAAKCHELLIVHTINFYTFFQKKNKVSKRKVFNAIWEGGDEILAV